MNLQHRHPHSIHTTSGFLTSQEQQILKYQMEMISIEAPTHAAAQHQPPQPINLASEQLF